MEIDIRKVRRYWVISFWLFFAWSAFDILFDCCLAGSTHLPTYVGKFLGLSAMLSATYVCAYKGNGVRLLVYLMTITSLSIFGELVSSSKNYDLIGMVLKAFLWFTCYRLLLGNAAISCKIKNENNSKASKSMESCDIILQDVRD